MKTINLKDNLEAELCILCPDESTKNFMVLAVSGKNQVGYCYFSFERDECKIHRIAVTNKKFLGKGLGNAMFKAMENFAYQNGIRFVSGIFLARGYQNAGEITSKFYKNQGFVPEDGDGFCDREEIFKQIKCTHPEFEAFNVVNKKLYDALSTYNFSTNDLFSSSHIKQNKKVPEPIENL